MKNVLLLFIVGFLCSLSSVKGQSCGSTNIALTKSVTASSHSDNFSLEGNVVDANSTTTWKSTSSQTQFIMVDLGQAYSICDIKLYWADQFYFPTDYKVYVSNNGAAASGTLVYSNSAADGGLDDISPGSPVSGRYVRVEATVRAASWADRYELIEFEVYAGSGNVLPTTSITSPSQNYTATAGTNITINADASDADGTISKVEFYEGTNKLGEDPTAPYSFVWTSAAAGTYSLTTKAIDNDNGVGTSGAVSITVSNASAGSGWNLTGNDNVNSTQHFLGTKTTQDLIFKTADVEKMRIRADGKVSIGIINSFPSDARLAVDGNIYARKLRITQSSWADFVFDPTYRLRSLSELEKYILQHKHLPDVPSAAEVEKDGLNVGDQQAVLLRKVEELTLYIIAQQKEIEELKKQVKEQTKTN